MSLLSLGLPRALRLGAMQRMLMHKAEMLYFG